MINLLFETSLNSPLGELGLLADDTYLIEISFMGLKGLSLRGKQEKAVSYTHLTLPTKA